MRRIADAYEAAGKLEHAYQWLTKAVRENPGVLIDHNGRSVTFLEYRKRLAHVRQKVEPHLRLVTLLRLHAGRDSSVRRACKRRDVAFACSVARGRGTAYRHIRRGGVHHTV